jgi:hypothetical protein
MKSNNDACETLRRADIRALVSCISKQHVPVCVFGLGMGTSSHAYGLRILLRSVRCNNPDWCHATAGSSDGARWTVHI